MPQPKQLVIDEGGTPWFLDSISGFSKMCYHVKGVQIF
jgi:hypothetical protein